MTIDFRFHYSQSEDRLAVVATENDRTAVMFLTRLLVERFLNALGTMIQKISPIVPHAPVNPAEVLAFEHERAMMEATGKGEVEFIPGALPKDEPRRLVSAIDLTPLPDGLLRIVFRAGEESLSLDLKHEAAHVVYSQIYGLAQQANWKLDVTVPWQTPAPTPSPQSAKLRH